MFKTAIMVNKREKIYYIISISDKRLFYFFISLILPLSFYSFLLFSLFFVLILSYLSRTCTFFFCRYIWAELSLLFWTFLSGTFFPGRGGARAPSASPPLRTRLTYAVSSRTARPNRSSLCHLAVFVFLVVTAAHRRGGRPHS